MKCSLLAEQSTNLNHNITNIFTYTLIYLLWFPLLILVDSSATWICQWKSQIHVKAKVTVGGGTERAETCVSKHRMKSEHEGLSLVISVCACMLTSDMTVLTSLLVLRTKRKTGLLMHLLMRNKLSPNAQLETISMEYPTVSGTHEEPVWVVLPQDFS